jgi:hypothetical protein
MTTNRAFSLGKFFAWMGLASLLVILGGLIWESRPIPLAAHLNPPANSIPIAAITLLVSSATGVIAMIGSASTIILGWRSDRRQSAEFKLKIEQLELQLAEARLKATMAQGPN